MRITKRLRSVHPYTYNYVLDMVLELTEEDYSTFRTKYPNIQLGRVIQARKIIKDDPLCRFNGMYDPNVIIETTAIFETVLQIEMLDHSYLNYSFGRIIVNGVECVIPYSRLLQELDHMLRMSIDLDEEDTKIIMEMLNEYSLRKPVERAKIMPLEPPSVTEEKKEKFIVANGIVFV